MAKKSSPKKSSSKKRAAGKKVAARKPISKSKKVAVKKRPAAKIARVAVKKAKASAKKLKAPAKKLKISAKKLKAPAKKLKAPAKKLKAPAKKLKAPAKKPLQKLKAAAKRVVAKLKKAVPPKKAAPAKRAAAKPSAAKPAPAPQAVAKPAPAPAPTPTPPAPKAAAKPVHDFCWAELETSDVAAAKAFYTQLFPWEMSDMPVGDGSVYSMATIGGGNVAGLYTMQAEMRAQGVSPHWNAYVSAPDVDASARRIKELGGKVVAEPFDVTDVGRMTVAQDPTGAVFCLWQARQHKGFDHSDGRPGTFCWAELMTSNVAQAGEFYGKLFGWSRQAVEMTPGEPYNILSAGEKQLAGMHPLPDELKAEGVPSNWLMYWVVSNCDATVDKASSLGALVTLEPITVPTVGRFAVLEDPQGATFAVLQPEPRG